MADLPGLLPPGSLLVFNDAKVRKARLIARSQGGGEAEFLLLESIDPQTWSVLVNRSKRRRPGSRYFFDAPPPENGSSQESCSPKESLSAELGGPWPDPADPADPADPLQAAGTRILRFERPIDASWLDRHGHIPLPPYIRRADTAADGERYQTVYAAGEGASAAAPTAGLHFTRELLAALEGAGMETAFITLQVGLGTFLPVRSPELEDHRMHRESYFIEENTAARIEAAKAEGRRIVAVGTTSVRTLESAWQDGKLRRGGNSTSIFIYPGYTFKVVDGIFTNFHTPGSTLLMLISAFAEAKAVGFADAKAGAFTGREFILESYAEAIARGYRFFSYGDAMLIR
jgi:S-adenosylmethionine:tRNA ribosyltransferase-isomerase